MAEIQIQSLSHRHEEIADWLLAHPHEKNLQKLANYMNLSRSWLSVVMRSDVFREYWARRRGEKEKDLRDKLVLAQLDLTIKAYSRLDEILSDEEVDDRLVLDIATKTAQAAGFGPSRGPRTTYVEEHTQELTRAVDSGTLAQARETIRRITRTEHAQLPAPDSE